MLPRNYTKQTLADYYKRTYLPLFITTEIWILFWSLYSGLHLRQTINCLLLIENPCPTMWYARMICRLYLLMPFFCIIMHRFKRVFLLGMCSVFILYSNFYKFDFSWILAKLHLADTNFMLYFFYMFIGYSIKSLKFYMFYVLVALAVIISIYFVLSSFHTPLWYNSPLLMLLSVPVFIALKCYCPNNSCVMTIVSRYSYGIYLSHMLLVLILYNSGLMIPIDFLFLVPIISFVVVLLATILIYVVAKLSPKFATVLFRI